MSTPQEDPRPGSALLWLWVFIAAAIGFLWFELTEPWPRTGVFGSDVLILALGFWGLTSGWSSAVDPGPAPRWAALERQTNESIAWLTPWNRRIDSLFGSSICLILMATMFERVPQLFLDKEWLRLIATLTLGGLMAATIPQHVRRLIDRKPLLVLDPIGLKAAALGLQAIDWADVQHFGVSKDTTPTLLRIHLKNDPDAVVLLDVARAGATPERVASKAKAFFPELEARSPDNGLPGAIPGLR